jgi:hypothetical protein
LNFKKPIKVSGTRESCNKSVGKSKNDLKSVGRLKVHFDRHTIKDKGTWLRKISATGDHSDSTRSGQELSLMCPQTTVGSALIIDPPLGSKNELKIWQTRGNRPKNNRFLVAVQVQFGSGSGFFSSNAEPGRRARFKSLA